MKQFWRCWVFFADWYQLFLGWDRFFAVFVVWNGAVFAARILLRHGIAILFGMFGMFGMFRMRGLSSRWSWEDRFNLLGVKDGFKDSERRLGTTSDVLRFSMDFWSPSSHQQPMKLQEVGHQCLHRDAPGGGFWGALSGVVSSDPRRAWAGGDPVAGGSGRISAILFGQDLCPRGALAPFFDVFGVMLWCVMLGFKHQVLVPRY